MYPLNEQIEELSGRIIGDMEYHHKKVVLLSDAIDALEQLENKLWALCQEEIRKVQAGVTTHY